MNETELLVYSRTEHGHRKDYIEFVGRIVPSRRANLSRIVFSKNPVLFLMIEENFLNYFLVSIFRSAIGRATSGLLFRPLEAANGKSIRLKLKRALLKLLKKYRLVRTITIVPFYLAKEISSVADNWIYDFQLWDLYDDKKQEMMTIEPDQKLTSELHKISEKRKLICALGSQNREKGFDSFIENSTHGPDNNIFYFFGGRVQPELKGLVEKLNSNEGGGFDRIISNNELYSLYSSADAIWCFYAKEYNQASGILGRAIQLGKTVIVRNNSLSHKLCQAEDIKHIALSDELEVIHYEDLTRGHSSASRIELIKMFREKSVKVMRESITNPYS